MDSASFVVSVLVEEKYREVWNVLIKGITGARGPFSKAPLKKDPQDLLKETGVCISEPHFRYMPDLFFYVYFV